MLRKLARYFTGGNRHSASPLANPVRASDAEGAPILLTHNMDGMGEDEKAEFLNHAAEATDIPVFAGHVEHGYDMAVVVDTAKCPRCASETKRHYGNFIYATQIAPRIMFAPAGYYCTKCPSVVVDQELIKAGIAAPIFEYQGVLGMDYENARRPDFFKTWNGERTVYILDEDQVPMGIETLSHEDRAHHAPPPPATAPRSKRKKRDKSARRARRKNRKK